MARTARKALSVMFSICLACLMTPFAAFGAEEHAGTQENGTQNISAQEGDTQEASEPMLTTASAKTPVNYREYTATVVGGKATLTYSDRTITNYVSISELDEIRPYLDDNTWYVVDCDYTIKGAICSGNTRLILTDGHTLTLKSFDGGEATSEPALSVTSTGTLTIYGQSGNTGKLTATSTIRSFAGISVAGDLNIHGGTIEASGTNNAAGIGSGKYWSGAGDITIYGGNITANGGKHGAGIGTGAGNRADGTVTIYGGNITAQGGEYGAGIGTGDSDPHDSNGSMKDGTNSMGVKIYGGTIDATGGDLGAGIGGGRGCRVTSLLIADGTITAHGGTEGAGIGGGSRVKSLGTYYGGSASGIVITGGVIEAYGGDSAAGIGGGYRGDLLDITISSGAITAQGGSNAAGIGAGERDDDKGGDASDITISGGTITAKGGSNDNEYGTAGIGGGAGGSLYGLTITGGSITAIGGNGTCRGCGIGGCYGKDIVISGGTVHAESSPDRGSAAIGCDYSYNSYSITISGGYVQATSHYNGAAIGCGSWAPANANSYVRITGGTVIAESNADGKSASACTALGVGLRNGSYEGAGTVTIDPKLTIFNATVTPYPVIENTGGDMVSALTGIRKVIVKQEIVSEGVTCLYGERTSAQSEDDIEWVEATGVTITLPSDTQARLEFQREAAKDLFGLSEFDYERYLQDPDAQISMGVTTYTSKITDAAVETEGAGSEFSLRAVLTATYSSDCGEYVQTMSRVLTEEDFAAMQGRLHITIKVPEGKTVTDILHTSDDGTIVFDHFTANGTATFDYDAETNTVSVDIEHCSHLVVVTKDAILPATGDATPLAAAACVALVACACAAIARRRTMR